MVEARLQHNRQELRTHIEIPIYRHLATARFLGACVPAHFGDEVSVAKLRLVTSQHSDGSVGPLYRAATGS